MSALCIKLCGVRSPADAVLCAESGADEVGVVFAAKSRRRVSLDEARAIRAALPSEVPLVGVFLDASLDEALELAGAAGCAAVQLHGKWPAAGESGVPVYLALQVAGVASLDALGDLAAARPLRQPRWPARLLLDGPHGGSGTAFAWELARAARARCAAPLFVAGGLTELNVAAAIRAAAPDGVDVASGIEGANGFKDPGRVRAFVAAARAAAKELHASQA